MKTLRSRLITLNILLLAATALLLGWFSLTPHTQSTTQIRFVPDVKLVPCHRCRYCNTTKPLLAETENPTVAPDDNAQRFRPAVTQYSRGKHILCFETDDLSIRECVASDLDRLHTIMSDPASISRTSFKPHTSKAETRALLAQWLTGYEKGHTVPWGIALKKNNTLIGAGGFTAWYPDGNRCVISYTLDAAYDRSNYGPQLIQGLIEFGFKKLELQRIETYVRVDDAVGKAWAEKAGMSCEGLQREYRKVGDHFVSYYFYSLLKKDIRPF